MSQILAIISAALYGVADFSGGTATRSLSAWRVTAWSEVFGIPMLVLGLLVVDAPSVTGHDLIAGAIGGLFALVGVAMLYSALAAGTMSVVSPITGAVAALIPVVWGVSSGESIDAIQWFGITLAVFAVILMTNGRSHTRITPTVLLQALVAAVGFGIFFVALGQTNQASGLWPLAAARALSIPLAFLVAALRRSAAPPPGTLIGIVAFVGLADMASNLIGLTALQIGPLGINSVLISLYPAFTVAAAVVILRESPTMSQRVGIVGALVAAVILTV